MNNLFRRIVFVATKKSSSDICSVQTIIIGYEAKIAILIPFFLSIKFTIYNKENSKAADALSQFVSYYVPLSFSVHHGTPLRHPYSNRVYTLV